MAQALRLSRPLWAALAGTLALTAAGMARQVIKNRSKPSVAGAAGRLVIDDGGHGGVPVVFVHSFAGTSAHWAAQLEHLRRSRRAIAINLRGHGGSHAPADNDYTIPSLAQDIAAVADALDLQRFVLVGHSMGGSAAAAYAAQHPERLAGLVLVGTPGYMPPDIAKEVLGALETNYAQVMAEHWASMTQGAREHIKPRLNADMRRMSRKASKAMIAATFNFDPSPALSNYHGPALLVDTVHGEGHGALHQLVPRVQRERLTGTSHWPQLDDPATFNRLLDRFLIGVPMLAPRIAPSASASTGALSPRPSASSLPS
jgi:pimeloyl-ACP methyl ester carboxylesterase